MDCKSKQCEICKQIKAESEFYPKRFGDYSKGNRCKECITARSKRPARKLDTAKAKENWIESITNDIDGSDY